MSVFKKMLGVISLYLPPPANMWLSKMRGVNFEDMSTTWVGARTSIDGAYPELVTIGGNVTISFDVNLVAHTEPPKTIRDLYMPETTAPIQIKPNVFIGARAVILQGVTVNEWAIVAAGAIVTRDVPKYAIVGGNPARVIGDIRDRK